MINVLSLSQTCRSFLNGHTNYNFDFAIHLSVPFSIMGSTNKKYIIAVSCRQWLYKSWRCTIVRFEEINFQGLSTLCLQIYILLVKFSFTSLFTTDPYSLWQKINKIKIILKKNNKNWPYTIIASLTWMKLASQKL